MSLSVLIGKDNEACVSMPKQDSGLLEVLNDMRLDGVLIDVVIKADEVGFPGHRVVFAARSAYFKAMFSYGLKESHQRTIVIQGVTSNSMQTIVDYVYTGRCFLTKQNAADILMSADLFQMLDLKNAAVDFLMKNIDTNNCLLIRKIAEIHSCPKLLSKAWSYCRNFFKDIVLEDDFLSLEVADVVNYLMDDELSVHKEDAVFDAAMRWIKHKHERQCHMPSVFKVVRLPFVSPEYLKSDVTEEALVKNTRCCLKQVIYAREFHESGVFSKSCENSRRRPRCCASREVLFVIGGETKIANFLECVQDISYYDPDSRKWETLTSVPSTLRARAFCAVALRYDIYITGGALNNIAIRDARVYHTYLNKWDNLPPMEQHRYHHSSAVVNGEVYVIGGTDGISCLDHVEKYASPENKWRSIEPMVYPVKCPATTTYHGKLYVLGGFTDGYTISQNIQVFNPLSNEWNVFSCGEIDYTCAQAVTLSSQIYLLGGCSRTAKVYDPKTNAVRKVAEMTTKRDNCGVTTVRGKIYVTGGVSESNGASLNTAECYCPALDKWETISNMPTRLYRHRSVSMSIPVYQADMTTKSVKDNG